MSGLRVVVLGMMGRLPFGGQTWLYLSWLRGLAELGHDVWYVEDDSVWPYDPVQNTVTDDCSYASSHLARCMERIGLADRWAFRLAGHPDACYGVSESKLGELYGSSDVLLNVVGATDLREEQLRAPFRVYVQTDPVTAELRLANGDEHTREAFANHHVIATYGENYGADDSGVPLNGLRYVKTLTRLQGCPPDAVMIEDLGTVDLDVAALECGYTRPSGAGRPLEITVTDKGATRRLFGWSS